MKGAGRMLLTGHRQGGLSLIELMVALTLGLFMTIVVGGAYVSSKGSFRYADAMSRVQENARFAMELLARNIRMAGYMGCGDVSQYANVVNGGTNLFLDLSNPVRGYEGGVSTFPSEFSTAVANTDAIVLLGVDTSSEVSIKNHNASSAQIDTGTHQIEKGAILLITDCSHSAVFQMTGPTNTGDKTNIVHNEGQAGVEPGNCNKELGSSCPTETSYTFKPGASVLKLSANGYFIAPASSGSGNSLWTVALNQTGSTSAQELLEGVQNMQVEYGVDLDGNKTADRWQKADAVETAANWPNVMAVRVSLLLNTLEDGLSPVAQTYTYDGTSTTAGDRRVRRVYTATTTIRNRTQ